MEMCNNRVFLKGGRRIPVGCSALRYAITEGGVAHVCFWDTGSNDRFRNTRYNDYRPEKNGPPWV